jgi:acetyl esterase/lipase
LFLALLAAGIPVGCFADGPATNAAAPPSSNAPAPTVIKDLTYATINGQALGLDLYLPAGAAQGPPLPLMILVHGGGWGAGKKEDFGGAAREYTKHGYAAASVDYRLWKVAPFPAQITDVKAAVRWLRVHAKDYNLDPDRFGAMGHSAGGHLVALLGTSSDISQFDVGDNLNVSSKVQAVVDMAGPVDLAIYFKPKNPPGGPIGLFGGTYDEKKDLIDLGSPVKHIGANTPPFLIVSGLMDNAVGTVQPQLMAAALGKAGVPFQMMLIPGVPHGIDLKLPYGKGTLWDALYFFLDPILKPAASPSLVQAVKG